jgi:hypothetical protein
VRIDSSAQQSGKAFGQLTELLRDGGRRFHSQPAIFR